MTSKIVHSTAKGQITLPKEWRSRFKTDHYVLRFETKQIVVQPFHMEEIENEEVVFDAERDYEGKGVPVDEMIKILKKIRRG